VRPRTQSARAKAGVSGESAKSVKMKRGNRLRMR